MAKALIKRPDGTTVSIEGTPQEIAELVGKVEAVTKSPPKSLSSRKVQPQRVKESLPDLLVSLIDGGFFKKPKDLAAVRTALAELGHVFPVTTLSPALLRVVRRRHLRRIKQDKRWFYTG